MNKHHEKFKDQQQAQNFLRSTSIQTKKDSIQPQKSTLLHHIPNHNVAQLILEIFRKTCSSTIASNDFTNKLSLIKQLFFKRDFSSIFGDKELLHVYTAEYAPSRALCYYNLFANNDQLLDILATEDAKVFCMGAGNGAELVGISAAFNQLSDSSNKPLEIIIQDMADYSLVLETLESNLKETFIASKRKIEMSNLVYDVVLESNASILQTHLSSATLTTAFFLLNELLSASKKSFVMLLSKLVNSMKVGGYLLVVDSAGSFSELDIGGKTYMCFDLMDHMKCFACVFKEDSQWYRLPNGLHYPLKLNNMRYFVRLYKKL